jgi:hypothetical protein
MEIEGGAMAAEKPSKSSEAANLNPVTAYRSEYTRRLNRVLDHINAHQALSPRDLSLRKGICEPNGQSCTYSPAWVWVDFPLEKGKIWSATSIVTGETFIAEVAYQYKVEGVEKITTAAGQFDAYRISASERTTSRSKLSGSPISHGTSSFTDWVASINGKVVVVKTEYENSFGERFTRELVSAELR